MRCALPQLYRNNPSGQKTPTQTKHPSLAPSGASRRMRVMGPNCVPTAQPGKFAIVAAATEWGANCASIAQPGKSGKGELSSCGWEQYVYRPGWQVDLRCAQGANGVASAQSGDATPAFFTNYEGANCVVPAQVGKRIELDCVALGCKLCRIRPGWRLQRVTSCSTWVQTVSHPPRLATGCR
jgi:hypothetical protein